MLHLLILGIEEDTTELSHASPISPPSSLFPRGAAMPLHCLCLLDLDFSRDVFVQPSAN